MIDIDTDQWRVMHVLCVKNMMRSSGTIQMDRRSEAVSRRGETVETISTFFGYALMSAFVAGAVAFATHPVGEFLVICSLSLLVYGSVSDQCSSFLFTKKDLHVFGALPISALTHLISKISGSIAYQLLVCSALIAPAFFVILVQHGLISSLAWFIGVAFCVAFVCTVTIFVHLLSARLLPESTSKFGFAKLIIWATVWAIFLALWVTVVLPGFQFSEFGVSWNLDQNPLFLLFPPYWFICLLLVLEGQFHATSITGAILAIFGSVPVCLYLLVRTSTASLAKLSNSASIGDTISPSPKKRALSRWLNFGSLGYERLAIWKLAYTHLKRDATFGTVWFAYFPVLYFVAALVFGFSKEPLIEPLSASDHAWLLTWSCVVVFFYAFIHYEALRTSGHAPASWVIFVSPSEISRFTGLALNWVYVVFVFPVLILFAIALYYLLPSPTYALLHVISLGWLSYVALNLKSIINPALPFTRQIRSSSSTPRFCLNFLLVAVSGFVVFHTLTSWIYASFTAYGTSVLLGIVLCVAVRYVARIRHVRKFQNVDLIA